MSAGVYDVGGFSTVIEKLADRLGESGHEVTIGALMFKRLPLKHVCNVTRLPICNVPKLRKLLKSFDVVHNHHPLTNYLALVSPRPFVYHYHGAPNSEGLVRYSMLSSIKITKNCFDAIIAVSETAEAELRQHFGLNKIYVIYNGVDTSLFKPTLEGRFRKGSPQLLFVGNLYEHKNVEELILAMRALTKMYPEAHLQVVGAGSMFLHLRSLVAKLELERHVELVGRVPSFELPYYYASCDMYVTASRWELFGLPLLEAMACGKPVVASRIPAHMELIRKSNAGTTYSAGNINDLLEKVNLIYEEPSKYKNNAVMFARAHDWSTVARRILDVYARISRMDMND